MSQVVHPPDEIYTVEVYRDPRTEVAYIETWFLNGQRHRVGGPARIQRNRKTGAVVNEAWFMNGALHREDGPAMYGREPRSGRIKNEWWFMNGEQVPIPRPTRRVGARRVNQARKPPPQP